MNRTKLITTVILFVSVANIAKVGAAALSPEKIAQMQRDATDVLQIEVVRSTTSLMRGEWIEIDSYEVDTDRLTSAPDAEDLTELLDAVMGPQAPPTIRRGWKGKVYLNAKEAEGDLKRFNIAVFGHSFQVTPKQ